jgi:hypothetical protein
MSNGSGFRVRGSGFRFRVQGSGFRVPGSRFRVQVPGSTEGFAEQPVQYT